MISIRGLLVGLFSGLLFGTGWLVFMDAQLNTLDAFNGLHILPCLGVTVAAVASNLVSPSAVHDNPQVKLWLFVWFTVFCICVGCSIWILITEYPPPVDPYPGVGILVQTVCALFATFLFFIGRKQFHGDFEHY